MQAPREYGLLDIEIVQGATFNWTLQLADAKGEVVDLAGLGQARMQGRKKIDDPDPPLFDLNAGNADLLSLL